MLRAKIKMTVIPILMLDLQKSPKSAEKSAKPKIVKSPVRKRKNERPTVTCLTTKVKCLRKKRTTLQRYRKWFNLKESSKNSKRLKHKICRLKVSWQCLECCHNLALLSHIYHNLELSNEVLHDPFSQRLSKLQQVKVERSTFIKYSPEIR